jgi:hypothetical protein
MAGVTLYVEVLGQGGRASGVRVTLDGSALGGRVSGAGDVGGSDPGTGDLVVSPE